MKRILDIVLGGAAIALIALAFALYRLVPARRAYGFGAAIAGALYPFFPKRRKLAIDNILKAHITDDPAEATRIAKTSWCHMLGHICEALKVPSVVTKENWREHLDASEGADELVKLLLDSPDEKILLVSAHHGVWEAATNVLSFVRPMIAIARTLNNPYLARWMKKHHFRGPVTVVDKNHGLNTGVMRQWEREKAALTILVDQHYTKGITLDFMGRPAKCFTSASRLALRTKARMVVGTFVRKEPFVYKLVGGNSIQVEDGDTVESLTAKINKGLEACIRAYPGQYLWVHKRWRVK